MIRVNTKRGVALVNPQYITRVSLAPQGTVIDVAGQTWPTWCDESVEEIEQMIIRHNLIGHLKQDDQSIPTNQQ